MLLKNHLVIVLVAEITCSFNGKHKLVWRYVDFPHQALLKLEKWKVIGNVSL